MPIVIADPSSQDSAEMGAILQASGYSDVIYCRSAEEVFELLTLSSNAPMSSRQVLYGLELMIIDIGTPNFGRPIIEEIRNAFRYQDVPMLMTAAGSKEENIQTAFAIGATDFISKPARPAEFQARVRSCLRLKHEITRRKAREKELMEATNHLADLNKLLTKLSLIDVLTGIANRRCFDQSLSAEWRRAARNGKLISIILIDVDFFKQYNDRYGHQAGDDCLTQIATAIKAQGKRPGDLVARFGGEEFVLILPETDSNGALIVAENVRNIIDNAAIPHLGSSVAPNVTVSLGVCTIRPNDAGQSIDQLIRGADIALYKAKADGRNRAVVSEHSFRHVEPKLKSVT